MLEQGLCPISFIVKKKRILFFRKLIKSNENNIARKVMLEQWENTMAEKEIGMEHETIATI